MTEGSTGRVAAVIDLGTNAVRLLVARLAGTGKVEILIEGREPVFFGRAITPDGKLIPAKARPTVYAVAGFEQQAKAAGAEVICAVATAAARRLRKPQQTLETLFAELETIPKVISPEEEARLGFLGATYGLPEGERVCTVDIGGGSTEVAFGKPGAPRSLRSLPLGSQDLTARFVKRLPPERREYRALLQEVRLHLPRLLAGIPRNQLVCIGTGGTFKALGSMALELTRYDAEQLARLHLSLHKVQVLRRRLQELSESEAASLPGLEPARAGVMWAGAVLAEEIMKQLRLSRIRLARHDLRLGAFLAYCVPELERGQELPGG